MSVLTLPDLRYFEHGAASTVVSQVKACTLSPPALFALQYLLDELNFKFTDHAWRSRRGLTLESYRAGVMHVLGNFQLAKECTLEAELDVRAGLRAGTLVAGDPALRRGSAAVVIVEEDEAGLEEVEEAASQIFLVLRAAMLEAPPREAPATPPPAQVPHLSPAMIVYARRCIYFLGSYFLHSFARVCERSSMQDVIGLEEIERALKEDSLAWAFIEGMKVCELFKSEPRPRAVPAPLSTALLKRSISGPLSAQSGGSQSSGGATSPSDPVMRSRAPSVASGLSSVSTSLLDASFVFTSSLVTLL